MLIINADNTIELTRGDSAYISVPITNEMTGDEYKMASSDTLRFTIKRKETDEGVLVQKTAIGTNSFHILPSDTAALAFGKYVYDVELTTASGDVYTVIVPTEFKLLKEVTW